MRLALSRPSRRGVDRNPCLPRNHCRYKVAPRAGAWIETTTVERAASSAASRPSRRGVDRNLYARIPLARNPTVAPRAGAWIETRIEHTIVVINKSRPSRRGVDRNSLLALPDGR